MNMKIGVKLLVGFVSVVLLMTALALYSVRISEKSLEEAVGRSSVFLAEEMLKTVNRDIYLKIEALRVHTSHFLFQKLLMESNRQFERFDNVQEWINGKEAAWVSAPRGEVTPFMESLIQNPLSDSLRNEISKYYERRYGYPVFVEIFVTNRFGAVIAETNKTLDYRQDDESWWQGGQGEGVFSGQCGVRRKLSHLRHLRWHQDCGCIGKFCRGHEGGGGYQGDCAGGRDGHKKI